MVTLGEKKRRQDVKLKREVYRNGTYADNRSKTYSGLDVLLSVSNISCGK